MIEDLRAKLNASGRSFGEPARTANDKGYEIREGAKGAKIIVYDTGSVVVQGRPEDKVAIEASLHDFGFSKSLPPKPHPGTGLGEAAAEANRRVFVVYGHDNHARTSLEAMLRRWRLEPLILDQLPSEGQTIIEKLEKYQGQAGFAIVLATPDDTGHRAGHPDEAAFRARQNVVLELGMMLTLLGRSRVAILIKDPGGMERPSDIQGLIYIPFKDEVTETSVPLAKEMHAKGYAIDVGRL